jgi:hypothetical protein
MCIYVFIDDCSRKPPPLPDVFLLNDDNYSTGFFALRNMLDGGVGTNPCSQPPSPQDTGGNVKSPTSSLEVTDHIPLNPLLIPVAPHIPNPVMVETFSTPSSSSSIPFPSLSTSTSSSSSSSVISVSQPPDPSQQSNPLSDNDNENTRLKLEEARKSDSLPLLMDSRLTLSRRSFTHLVLAENNPYTTLALQKKDQIPNSHPNPSGKHSMHVVIPLYYILSFYV